MPSTDPDKVATQQAAYKAKLRAGHVPKSRFGLTPEQQRERNRIKIREYNARRRAEGKEQGTMKKQPEPEVPTWYRIRVIRPGVDGRAIHITPATPTPELAALALMRDGVGLYKAFSGAQLWLDKGDVVREGGRQIVDWIRHEKLGEPKG